MRFANTVELKNRLNAVLAEVRHGETIIVTHRGKPAAALVPAESDQLEQILFERSALVRRAVEEGVRDLKAGRAVKAQDYAARRFGKGAARRKR